MNPSEYCILVAEDHEILRYAMAKTLSEHGYCVLQAQDGRQAMRLEGQYDGLIQVLITNAQMPQMGGHELALAIKRKRPDIKVLIVSSEDEPDFPLEAHGHDFALLKPVDSETVLATVALLLRQSGQSHPPRTATQR